MKKFYVIIKVLLVAPLLVWMLVAIVFNYHEGEKIHEIYKAELDAKYASARK